MTLVLKQDCKYSLLVATSMGVRITPVNAQPVHSSRLFEMQATSAETNVANISSSLGLPVKVLTAFVKDSPIAAFIKSDLHHRNMDYEGPEVPQGGPWGYRHQFNIADTGFGLRGPRVQNDRAGEVGRTLNAKDFDLERIFGQEGVQIVHLSGLIAALSPETSEFCVEIARTAKKHGSLISFDLNYRASFWEGRETELKTAFSEIASLSDILIGNEEDYQLCLGIEGPNAGGEDIGATMDAFKGMIANAQAAYPNVTVFANTLREVVSANEHLWGAIVFENDRWHIIRPRKIYVLDRIGGGDGFVGGLLYSILKGWNPEKWTQFAWASGALATTFLTDYAQPADEEMVWSIWLGNARVKR
ncbi:MAG TPA: 2-keto-3-deoxygluconate kinase [Porphyromonadaceae bacterium]|jgi:2-dehydro-3-deoxygluconokinase|nr:2-keto-3-deoxygluconate kinase [Porphyromonadaceae bacterium]HBL34844.1 2-keto-3-deoxygluconate kinase [Porphyromonadaceae bacterium]HBX21735.1 2-keto-3-deoxygluconate kinase [Porphyromonadaceae bacterium]HCM22464.1 2-keto-3-deoxygluconate kinase [Porphyromonadaceae bacterium]